MNISTPITNRQSARAFTLIELLTVIAIIGILAAIIIPTVGKVRETAKNSQCVSNVRQIATSLSLYASDNKEMLPAIAGPGPNDRWYGGLEAYLPKRKAGSGSLNNAVFVCPNAPGNFSYSEVDESLIAFSYAPGGGMTHPTDNTKPRKISTIVNPTRAPWVLDGARQGSGAGVAYAHYNIYFQNNIISDRVEFRHQGGARLNIAFADASVRSLAKNDVPTVYPNARTWLALE